MTNADETDDLDGFMDRVRGAAAGRRAQALDGLAQGEPRLVLTVFCGGEPRHILGRVFATPHGLVWCGRMPRQQSIGGQPTWDENSHPQARRLDPAGPDESPLGAWEVIEPLEIGAPPMDGIPVIPAGCRHNRRPFYILRDQVDTAARDPHHTSLVV